MTCTFAIETQVPISVSSHWLLLSLDTPQIYVLWHHNRQSRGLVLGILFYRACWAALGDEWLFLGLSLFVDCVPVTSGLEIKKKFTRHLATRNKNLVANSHILVAKHN